MNRMWGIIAIISFVLIFLFYFKKLATAATATKGEADGPFVLETKPQIGTSDMTRTVLSQTNTGTLSAYVYPLQAQKTGTVVLCNPSGSANPGEPECSTGQYAMCKCLGNDCSKCVHSGYVNLLNISNVIRVEILAAPDASRQKAAGAQLVVRTVGMSTPPLSACPIANSEISLDATFFGSIKACCDAALVDGQCPGIRNENVPEKICIIGDPSSAPAPWVQQFLKSFSQCASPTIPKVQTVYEETIPLPNIPFQKWTYVTVAREGRRFDIYYNGKLVASKRTQNIVDLRTGFGPIVAGDPALTGKVALVEALPQKLAQAEVEAKFKQTSDTTGKPLINDTGNILDYIPSCKGGSCITGPSVRPASPLLDWQTQYA